MYIMYITVYSLLLVVWYATLLCTTLGIVILLRAVDRFLRNGAILRKKVGVRILYYYCVLTCELYYCMSCNY